MKSEKDYQCPFCHKNESFFLFWNSDFFSKQRYPILKCENCGLARTDLKGFKHRNSYPENYYPVGNNGFLKILHNFFTLFREKRGVQIDKLFSRPGRILDIGCGDATMLSFLAQKGWESHGTELSAVSAKEARKKPRLKIDITENVCELNYPDQYFDVVTLWHVLEHIPNINDTLKEIRRILKPSGYFILEVPNFSSFQSIIGKGKWFHLDAPRHIYHFEKETLNKLLFKHGFSSVNTVTGSIEMGIFGMLQTFLNRILNENNILYGVLIRKKPRNNSFSNLDIFFHIILHLVLVPFLIPICFIAEGVAVIFSKGSVLRSFAKAN